MPDLEGATLLLWSWGMDHDAGKNKIPDLVFPFPCCHRVNRLRCRDNMNGETGVDSLLL